MWDVIVLIPDHLPFYFLCYNMGMDITQLKVGSQIHVCIDHIEQELSLDSIARLTRHVPIMMTKF